METRGHMTKIRLDALLIKQALCGLDERREHMFEPLNKVPEVAHKKEDLDAIMEDACELCNDLLEYEYDKSAAWTRSTWSRAWTSWMALTRQLRARAKCGVPE